METMSLLTLIFDSLLGLGLLWLSWRVLACPDLFKAIVLFIAFGLLMALAWVRLDAPDVALAEAAIGAGLTGALMLAAFAKLREAESNVDFVKTIDEKNLKPRPSIWIPFIALLFVVYGLGSVVMSLPPDATGLSVEVTANLDSSGVKNPVTAVLLNFRGYDTLLEMVVLLIALLGVWSLADVTLSHDSPPGPVLKTLSHLLTPVLILVSAYLLWVGADAPGGAFQAGSVLSAAGVLLILTGWRPRPDLLTLPLRIFLVVGAGSFVTIASITLFMKGQLLAFPPEHAGKLILILETAATLSIAVTLAALFIGGCPQNKESE